MTSWFSQHVTRVLLVLVHVLHLTRGADLVIRIPGGGQVSYVDLGGGQPQDGLYRLDYR